MRKPAIALLTGIVLSTMLFCQTNETGNWAITFTPCIISSAPVPLLGIQPGVEYKMSSRFKILTEVMAPIQLQKKSIYTNTKYFRVRPELRYYFENRPRLLLGDYVGLQFSYTHRAWENPAGGKYFRKTQYDDSCINYNTATVISPIITATIQTGYLLSINDRLSLDIFYGIGLRKIITDYVNQVNSLKIDNNYRTCVPTIVAAYRFDHAITRFHMNVGLRFLYDL
jgi:hypothetical protein